MLRRLYPDLPRDRVPDRYPPRILLCSLMIIHHPEVRSFWGRIMALSLLSTERMCVFS